MILFPNAKINLGLHVLSLRMDGYHNIETLVIDTGLCDILEFIEAGDGEMGLSLSGNPVTGRKSDNLVMKAWNLLHEKYDIPAVKIHLHKIIPPGAGLGGGSSDAAFMLKGLNEYFKLGISPGRLMLLANTLGSDCSFFIDNKPAVIEGKGDILTPSPKFIRGHYLCIFYPGIFVSTREAYEKVITSGTRDRLIDILFRKMSEWKDSLVNDFETGIFLIHPELNEIKAKVYESGAIYSAMSGSGSSIIGIFTEKPLLPEELKKILIWEEFVEGE